MLQARNEKNGIQYIWACLNEMNWIYLSILKFNELRIFTFAIIEHFELIWTDVLHLTVLEIDDFLGSC